VNYWRCEIPAKHLPGVVRPLTEQDCVPDKDGEPSFPNQEGAAIWPFPGNLSRALVMRGMQEAGSRVLVEVDDNYLAPPTVAPGTEGPWQMFIDQDRLDDHSTEAHRKIVRFADGVIVSTEHLGRIYGRLNPNVYVCRNSVDPDDWDDPPPQDDVFTVGFAGSVSHFFDLQDIRRALGWLEDQPGVEIVSIGGLEFTGTHKHIDWTDDLAAYRKNLLDARLDVGLAPLRPGGWADAKSDVKALEYAMAGAVPVVSDVEAYSPWQDEGPCYWVPPKSPKGWLKVLKHIVTHKEEARAMAWQARLWVLGRRTIQREIGEWRRAVAED